MNTHDNYPASAPEAPNRLGLREAVASFEGTAFAQFIATALTEAGIDPNGYDPKRYGHNDYLGLLATSPTDKWHASTTSPIVHALEVAVVSGKIVEARPEPGSVDLPAWNMHQPGAYDGNAWRTAKLMPIGMYEFKDAESGETLAYAARLGSDGGREGYAILSTNDVIVSRETS